jgi:hypothetical protein
VARGFWSINQIQTTGLQKSMTENFNSDVLELYQKYCNYPVTSEIQAIDIDLDIDRLRAEVFSFITRHNFGFSSVSLKLPEEQTDWTAEFEDVRNNALEVYKYHYIENNVAPKNIAHNNEYICWHPDFENSYVKEIEKKLEEITKLKIGRVRLAWLLPNTGYVMHRDLEPMRFHIPLITNKLSYFIHDGEMFNMEYGKIYHLVTTSIHNAYNFGSLPRLHLIFSSYADSLISNMEKLTEVSKIQKTFLSTLDRKCIDNRALEFLLKLHLRETPDLAKSDKINEMKELKRLLDNSI